MSCFGVARMRGDYMLLNPNVYTLPESMYTPALKYFSNNPTQIVPPQVALKVTFGPELWYQTK